MKSQRPPDELFDAAPITLEIDRTLVSVPATVRCWTAHSGKPDAPGPPLTVELSDPEGAVIDRRHVLAGTAWSFGLGDDAPVGEYQVAARFKDWVVDAVTVEVVEGAIERATGAFRSGSRLAEEAQQLAGSGAIDESMATMRAAAELLSLSGEQEWLAQSWSDLAEVMFGQEAHRQALLAAANSFISFLNAGDRGGARRAKALVDELEAMSETTTAIPAHRVPSPEWSVGSPERRPVPALGQGVLVYQRAEAAKPARGTRGAKRKPNAAFMKPVTPSTDLAQVVGSKAMTRTELTVKLWAYIKKNGLQDKKNRRMINADAALKSVFGGKKQVSMFEMTKLVSKHVT